MIRAVLFKNSEGAFTGYTVEGHALWADEGSDIVCAAVSVLAYSCANALESVCGLHPEASARKGNMRVRLPENAGHDAQVVLGVLRQGLRDLREQYPDFIALNEKYMEE